MSLTCKFCNRESSTKGGSTIHQNRCHSNPNRRKPSDKWYATMNKRKGSGQNQYTKHGSDWVMSDETRKKLADANRLRTPSEDTKAKISESMIKAHAEGRAWNIGKSRWNSKPSYPETFFMRVIENEFSDKQYVQEYPIGVFSCDFAWVHKKKCIEIDGEQHYRFEEYVERDKRKDAKLLSEGWEVLRINWKECFSDPKKLIQTAKEFIDDCA